MKISLWGARGGVSVLGQKRDGMASTLPVFRSNTGGYACSDGGIGLHSLGNALLAESFGSGKGSPSILRPHWSHTVILRPPAHTGNSIHLYGRATGGMQRPGRPDEPSLLCPDFLTMPRHRLRYPAAANLQFADHCSVREIGQVHGSPRLGYRISDGMNALAYVPL